MRSLLDFGIDSLVNRRHLVSQPGTPEAVYGYVNLESWYFKWDTLWDAYISIANLHLTEANWDKAGFHLMKYNPEAVNEWDKWIIDYNWKKRFNIQQRVLLSALERYNRNLGEPKCL